MSDMKYRETTFDIPEGLSPERSLDAQIAVHLGWGRLEISEDGDLRGLSPDDMNSLLPSRGLVRTEGVWRLVDLSSPKYAKIPRYVSELRAQHTGIYPIGETATAEAGR